MYVGTMLWAAGTPRCGLDVNALLLQNHSHLVGALALVVSLARPVPGLPGDGKGFLEKWNSMLVPPHLAMDQPQVHQGHGLAHCHLRKLQS